MNDFRFSQPQFAHLLWLVLLLAIVLVWLESRGRSALDQFLSRAMQRRLVHASSLTRRLLAASCLLLGLTALVFAAMRPQWGATLRTLPRADAQIMICLDVSKSMLAEDTVPNRLERAKAEIADLLDLMRGEQVGLIAFAGKATIISPMTADFGFLKLMLENVGVQSVGRGGTRLEEPIRKAVEGFGEAADISRVILLITDGEDHDSFPLDAAEEARERGIKIITIGFGDEAGSKIEISDRRTGARKFVTDRDGTPVISRLDGTTLREIALKTEGAYIPAGTGALDLVSIYRQHIAPLVRGTMESGQQIVRNEAFQWVVLAGLLLILLSVAVARGVSPVPLVNGTSSPAGKLRAFTTTLLIVCLCFPHGADGQPTDPDRPASAPTSSPAVDVHSDDADTHDPGTDSGEVDAVELDSREAYNQALPLLASNADAAESLLQQARRGAGTDGEVRFRSAYNLGWVEVERADRLLDSEPKQALIQLRSAADWFRQSIRIRPKDTDARHNLEIVMRRALELADSLAKKEQGGVEKRLDRLIEEQRGFVRDASQLVERLAENDAPSPDSDIFRRDFRSLATTQRPIVSDAQALLQSVAEEQNALERKSQGSQGSQPADGGLTDEERMRTGQLEAVGSYLQRAIQRMGQSRSQLRRKQGQRAFRRASMGLSELKRARDMLRPPHEILRMLANETRSLMKQTGLTAATADPATIPRPHPSWLTGDFLKESQQSLTERTQEWTDQMQTAFGDSTATGPPRPGNDSDQEQVQSQRAAIDLVKGASESFVSAETAMESGNFASALDHQNDAYVAISNALETYLDLKGLIEATHATQQRIEQTLRNAENVPEDRLDPIFSALAELQDKNLDRADRLENKIDQERDQLEPTAGRQPAGPPAPGDKESSDDSQQMERQRLELARELLDQARTEMHAMDHALRNTSARPSDSTNDITDDDITDDDITDNEEPPASSGASDEAMATETEDADDGHPKLAAKPAHEDLTKRAAEATERLQDLRRLFYSVVEHLEETARRQNDINDQTQELSGEHDPANQQKKLGPLTSEQQQLDQLSQQIADALQDQSENPPPQAPPAGNPSDEQRHGTADQSQQLREASQLVRQAVQEMQTSLERMLSEPLQLADLRQSQDGSLDKLAEALALLVPPQEQNNDQDQQQDREDQQESDESKDDEQQEDQSQNQPQPKQQENLSMNQLLQLIRDRDAQRRRDKEERRAVGTVPVEKDW